MIRKIAERKKKKASQFGIMSGPEDKWMKYALIPGATASGVATALGAAGSIKKWRAKKQGKRLSSFWRKGMKLEKPLGRAALAISLPLLTYKAYKVWKRMKKNTPES